MLVAIIIFSLISILTFIILARDYTQHQVASGYAIVALIIAIMVFIYLN